MSTLCFVVILYGMIILLGAIIQGLNAFITSLVANVSTVCIGRETPAWVLELDRIAAIAYSRDCESRN